MRRIQDECVAGNIVFYVVDAIPHTATVVSNAYGHLYRIKDINLVDEPTYSDGDDIREGFIRKDICIHSNQVYLPTYGTDEVLLRRYISLGRMYMQSKDFSVFPKRAIYKSHVNKLRPFIYFKEGMLFKIENKKGDERTYFYYTDNGEVTELVDIDDPEHRYICSWENQECHGSVTVTDQLRGTVVNEDNILMIWEQNPVGGFVKYGSVKYFLPPNKYWNIIYRKND